MKTVVAAVDLTPSSERVVAVAAELARGLGAKLYLTARNIEPLSALAESIRLRTGTAPEYHALDLADLSQVTLFAKKWRDEKQPLDILINNAATWLSGPMESHDAFAIQQTVTANVTATSFHRARVAPKTTSAPAATRAIPPNRYEGLRTFASTQPAPVNSGDLVSTSHSRPTVMTRTAYTITNSPAEMPR